MNNSYPCNLRNFLRIAVAVFIFLSIIKVSAYGATEHALSVMSAGSESAIPLEQAFRKLGKDSLEQPVETRKINFPTYHPQGMTAVGDRFFLSSVEVIDRAAEQGRGHLFELDRQGNLLREIQLGEGPLYHPGGIDYDGTDIWVSVAAYRPDSAAIVYAVDPETMESREVLRFSDHLGAVSHFPDKGLLIGVNWGSRGFYRWKTEQRDGVWSVPDPANPLKQDNGNHYIDYQDMQRISGTPFVLCAGLQSFRNADSRRPALSLGGIDMVHIDEFRAYHQIPMPVRPTLLPAWTQNPFFVESFEQGLRFFFIPEDNNSFIHIFEVNV